MTLNEAISILADVHTHDDSKTDYFVQMAELPPPGMEQIYVEAWGVLWAHRNFTRDNWPPLNMGGYEDGKACLVLDLDHGRLTVRHGSTDDVLLEREPPNGFWEWIFGVLEKLPEPPPEPTNVVEMPRD